MTEEAIAVFGSGAVGSFFGGMLARAGVRVTMIGRPRQVEAIRTNGLFLETTTFSERVRVTAETEPAAIAGARIVLVCVKTLDTEAVARAIAPHVQPGTLVLSLQNGVDNAERMRAAAGIDVLPVVVYVGVSAPEPGHVKHLGAGNLVLPAEPKPRIEALAATFARGSVPCRLSENIEGELWVKLILNAAFNAISAVTQASYGKVIASPEARSAMLGVVDETLAVADAAKIRLPVPDMREAALKLASMMPLQTSSTAQDLVRGVRTEIDALNGHVVARGRELGVPTPANQLLLALVKLLEPEATRAAG